MSGAFGFWLVKTWKTFEAKNIISSNYKFLINDDFEINMPKLLLVQVSQRGYLKFSNGGLMAKNLANMGWQFSRINKRSRTFPSLLTF